MNENENETATPAPTDDTKPTRQAVTVLAAVSERIGASGPAVRERVVSALVEREVVARVELLDKALAKRTETEKDLRKLKPDVENYDADGKLVSSSYSKAKADELKKARESLDKLEKALDKALVDNDFSKLRELSAK
jgi:hypothetical protein